MSEQLIQVFFANAPIHLDDQAQSEGEPKLLWKAVLRTGTWKLRPGPGGVKLNSPLKIYRDKAPKGHISMAELVKNFEAGAKEHVTIPMVHADGTTSDGGFVKKLVIQDVPGEDGKGTKQSLLWAGLEITDSELQRKLAEKSIRGVSGGILFDYERTEDAKKFPQVLSHVMVTNSPWINGTGDFKDSLPEGVMASEPDDLPFGEVEFSSRETDHQPQFPIVELDDGPAADTPSSTPASGAVVWKPEQGFRYLQGKVQKALRDWRDAIMASVPQDQRYTMDWPYFSVDDVSAANDGGTALICSGYGSDQDSWVANFKLGSDGEAELDPFVSWTSAKQEWVAASEDQPTPPPAPPADRDQPPAMRTRTLASTQDLGLREAQAVRAERTLGTTPNTGGSMGLMDLLSGVNLSDEQREALLAEERRMASLEESETQRRARERRAEVVAYCGETKSDGTVVKGKLDEIGLGDPGVKKFLRNALLSDDGGPAIEFSVHLDDGSKTTPVPKTSTELLKEFVDLLPKSEQGRANLSEQARRLPGDPKPPEENNDDGKLDMSTKAVGERSDALLAELRESGYDAGVAVPSGGGA